MTALSKNFPYLVTVKRNEVGKKRERERQRERERKKREEKERRERYRGYRG
jgi:hypothetical protein